jgi:hypothetical protein
MGKLIFLLRSCFEQTQGQDACSMLTHLLHGKQQQCFRSVSTRQQNRVLLLSRAVEQAYTQF